MPSSNAFSFSPGVPEQIADHLQALIVRGELAPGERIAEARVTKSLGVSRGPVREALRLLVARHLVVVEPRRGARVSDFSTQDVRSLYDMFAALLGLAAIGVADRLDDVLAAALVEHRDHVASAAAEGDLLNVLACSHAFISDACLRIDNVYLHNALDRLAPVLSRAHYRALTSAPRQVDELARFIDTLIEAVSRGVHDEIRAIVDDYAAEQVRAILDNFDA